MYKGQLQGFSIEIVKMMVQKQQEQGNEPSVAVFENNKVESSQDDCEGFEWAKTIEGHDFWFDVIANKKFDVFFDKYPKQKELPKYFAVKRDANNFLWQQYINFLNKTYKNTLDGSVSEYYGYSHLDKLSINFSFERFGKEAVLLTLEEWYDLFIKPTQTNKMKKEFPKYFILDRKDNEKSGLWATFIDWMNVKYREINGTAPFTGIMDDYYGFDGTYTSRSSMGSFSNSPQVVTIQEWYDNIYKTNKMEKEITGYKLIKPEYKSAVNSVLNLHSFSFERFEKEFQNYSSSILDLKKAGVLDLWFEPVYKTEEVTYIMGKSVTGTFQLVVKDGRVFHKSEDITKYVKDIQSIYTSTITNHKIANYDFTVKDVVIAKTGCESVETLLSQWLAIKL